MTTREVLNSDGSNLIHSYLNSTPGTFCDRADNLADLQYQEAKREAERVERDQREERLLQLEARLRDASERHWEGNR